MNLAELQAELRHFAAERDWQPFHTPKNLSTALMVEAAELAEVFQWMTPGQSRLAHQGPAAKQSIAEEVADVLLYLLQVADHCEVNVEQAARDKLARNAMKYPAKRLISRVSPTRASVPGTHVLLDYENVQPSEEELRHMVPDAGQVWVFHGPQQRQVEQRFASFGTNVTAVPISRTGKNALDFHLSFYVGYIASRNPASTMVVVANDKGYEPMLEHARGMGFVVRRQSHGPAKPVAKKAAATKVAAKKVAAKKASPAPAVKKVPTAKAAPTKKAAPAKSAAAKPAISPPPKVAVEPILRAAGRPAPVPLAPQPARPSTVSADEIKKITENLRKLGTNRPTKPVSLRRLLKSLLAAETGDASIEAAFGKLVSSGVVAVGTGSEVTYPAFDLQQGAGPTSP